LAAVEEQVQVVRQLAKEAQPFVQTLKSEEEKASAMSVCSPFPHLLFFPNEYEPQPPGVGIVR